MPLDLPTETDFVERGFSLSVQHAPKDAVVSYVRSYPDGWELILTFNAVSHALHVQIKHNGESVTELTQEAVESAAFQAWHTEKILRVYFKPSAFDLDARVHYAPVPRVRFTGLEA